MKQADEKCGFSCKIREVLGRSPLSRIYLPPPRLWHTSLWGAGALTCSVPTPSHEPWPWGHPGDMLGTSQGLPANPSRLGSEVLLCGSGMGCPTEQLPRQLPIHLPSPIRSILFVFKLSLRVCRAALGWLCSQLHPLMSVGLRWWNQEKNLAPCRFIPPLLSDFFFLTRQRLSPACCLACPGLLPPLGWELLLCSSCCLARLRCFGSNLGSKHICSAFCFLPPSLLAVKHFIIQTLRKAPYKRAMKLWGYLFWCGRSNSISYFPPLIFPSLDST